MHTTRAAESGNMWRQIEVAADSLKNYYRKQHKKEPLEKKKIKNNLRKRVDFWSSIDNKVRLGNAQQHYIPQLLHSKIIVFILRRISYDRNNINWERKKR